KRSMHTSAFEDLGMFQREHASAAEGHAQPGNGAHIRRPAYAQIVVRRFQQGYVCSECGGQVRENARFCLHCGKTFAPAEATAGGQSCVGAALAAHLGWPLLDTDALIAQSAGRTVAQIFADAGEPRFRELEAAALQRAFSTVPCVVSTGGGIVLRPENRALLR